MAHHAMDPLPTTLTPPGPSSPPAARRWLCIAYAFPPIRRSGTHRTLAFVRHLADWGWHSTVVTVEPGQEPTDPELLKEIPPTTRVLRTRWYDLVDSLKRCFARRANTRQDAPDPQNSSPSPLPPYQGGTQGGPPRVANGHQVPTRDANPRRDQAPSRGKAGPLHHRARQWLTRLLQIPDNRLGWFLPAVKAGLRAAREEDIQLIYSTSPYPTAHLVAMAIATWTRKPWVADFRDPWDGNPFDQPLTGSLRAWNRFLERRVLRRATHIVCASPTIAETWIATDPTLRGKCTTVFNGFDRTRTQTVAPLRDRDIRDCILVHAGQFYGTRNPTAWFHAIRIANDPAAHDRTSLRRRTSIHDGVSLRRTICPGSELLSCLPFSKGGTKEGPVAHASDSVPSDFARTRVAVPPATGLTGTSSVVAGAEPPEPRRRIRLHLIGPTHYHGQSLLEIARACHVEFDVRILGGRSHAETLARIAGADGVLLPTSSGQGAHLQIPNKLFEYLALRRPILAAADVTSPVRAILRDAAVVAQVVDPDDVDALARGMIRLRDSGQFEFSRPEPSSRLAPAPYPTTDRAGTSAWSNVDAFDRVHRARELLDIFNRVAAAQTRVDSPPERAAVCHASV